MDKNRVKQQLLGLAAINGILMVETDGSGYWSEWTKELTNLLLQAGEELESMYREDELETQEMETVTAIEYDAERHAAWQREMEAQRQIGTWGG